MNVVVPECVRCLFTSNLTLLELLLLFHCTVVHYFVRSIVKLLTLQCTDNHFHCIDHSFFIHIHSFVGKVISLLCPFCATLSWLHSPQSASERETNRETVRETESESAGEDKGKSNHILHLASDIRFRFVVSCVTPQQAGISICCDEREEMLCWKMYSGYFTVWLKYSIKKFWLKILLRVNYIYVWRKIVLSNLKKMHFSFGKVSSNSRKLGSVQEHW